MVKAPVASNPADGDQDTKKKRAIQRSPNYPYFNLETALARAKTMLDTEGRHEAPVNVVLGHWGYTNFASSNAQSSLSALVKFGLLKSIDKGGERKVQLSDMALKILLDERQPSPDRDRLIQEAALLPQIHKELWQKWGAALPSEANMRTYLLLEKKFNSAVVDDFIKEYKSTIAFAKLDKSEGHEKNGGTPPAVKVGDYVQWSPQGVAQFEQPRRVRWVSDDGGWAAVDDNDTGLPMAELSVESPPAGAVDAPLVPPGQKPLVPPAPPRQSPITGGPRIEFPLPNDNAIEIRLKKPVSQKDFERIKKLVELSEDSLVSADAD